MASVQKQEILWDVDWDGLDPLPQSGHSPVANVVNVPAAGLEIELSAVQERVHIPEPQRVEPVVQAAPAQSPPPPSLPSSASPSPLLGDPIARPPSGPQAGKELVRGERLDLGPIFAQNPQISIELISSNPAAVKLICLGLDADEIVAGSAYCVGPRQPVSHCGGVSHAVRGGGGQEILFRASILPISIKRLEVSVVSSGSGASLGNTVEGIRLWAGDLVVAESRHLDPACASSSCATLVEIYERQGIWRMRMIGEVIAHSVNELLAKHGAKTG